MSMATKKKAVARRAEARDTSAQIPVPVRFGRDERRTLRLIQAKASAEDRSVSGQIKHYVRIGLIAEDNPDLPISMIKDILAAQEESKAGLGQPYRWGVLED